MPLMRKSLHGPATPEIHVLHGLLDGPMHGRYGRNDPRHDDMFVAAVDRSLPRDEDESQVSIAGILDAKQVGNINVGDVNRFCDVLEMHQSKPPIGQTNGGSRRDSSHSSQIAYVEQLFNEHGYGVVNGCTQPAIGERLSGPVREWGVPRP